MGKAKLPRGLRNNNPCNIRIGTVKYNGEVVPSQDRAFKQFESMAFGYRAVFVLLHTYQKRYGLNTIERMIARYAPPIENDTGGYVKTVSSLSGVQSNVPISTTDASVMIPIVTAMSFVENGVEANVDDVRAGWDLFIGK